MFKTLKKIGYSLEFFERYYPKTFWTFIVIAALLFNQSVKTLDPYQHYLESIERIINIKKGGGNQNENVPPNYFIPPDQSRPVPGRPKLDYYDPPDRTDGSFNFDNYEHQPRRPWGVDPKKTGGSGGSAPLYANQIPDSNDWISDPQIWDGSQAENSSEEKEESDKGRKIEADIDFSYEYDVNGNPTLLVPDQLKSRTNREYNRVEFDQTASHMHHAPDFDIPLPENFDMTYYKGLDKADKIAYAKENLPQETIINYQNEIGKAMSPLFGPKETRAVIGFIGKNKRPSEISIQISNRKDKHIISVTGDNGVHISSYKVTNRKLEKIVNDDFWLWRNK